MENTLALALLLIVVGLVLMIAELFLPAHGMLIVAGLTIIVVGVLLSFSYGGITTGFLTMLAVFVVVPTAFALALQAWKHSPMSRKMILRSGAEDDATVATMPVHLELEQLRGRYGRAVSYLRPSGMVDFDGRRVDCITEGMMVEAGTFVRCIDVRAGRVVVRPMDPPELAGLENLEIT